MRTRSLLLAAVLLGGANDAGIEETDRPSALVPTGAFAAFLTGRGAALRADLDTAAEQFETALQYDQGNPELGQQAFLAALMAGRPEAARLAERLPGNQVAQLLLADREAAAGNWDQAEARYDALPRQGVADVLRPLLVAWAKHGAGHSAAALASLQPLVDGPRYRGVFALHAALIADQAGRTTEAAALYRTAAAEYGPLNLRLGVILASWQARQLRLPEAERTLREMVATNGELAIALPALEAGVAAPTVLRPVDGIAEAYLAMAATVRQQNATEMAQVLLRLALELRPDFTPARLLMADIQAAAKRNDAALATLDDVGAGDPLLAIVRLRRAGLLDAAGRHDEAASVLEALAREYPGQPEPLAQLAASLRRRKQFAEAAAAFDRAIDRLPQVRAGDWTLLYERAVALDRAGQWDRAEGDLQHALQLAPEQPYVLNYLAYSWTERGTNLDRARGMLERAVAIRPEDGSIVDSLGWVLLRAGDVPGALRQLERAVELEPDDATINGHLGDAYLAAGRIREAEVQWRRALSRSPEADEERRIRSQLDALPKPPVDAP